MDLASNFPRNSKSIQGDAVLRRIVNMINLLDVDFGMVLVVPGGVVAGKVTSVNRWNGAWMSQLRESGPGGRGFADGLEILINEYGYVFDDEFPKVDTLSIAHLKDATIFSGDKEIANLLVRVRLEEVSAWSFGSPKADA